jgi:hypothetical protein
MSAGLEVVEKTMQEAMTAKARAENNYQELKDILAAIEDWVIDEGSDNPERVKPVIRWIAEARMFAEYLASNATELHSLATSNAIDAAMLKTPSDGLCPGTGNGESK